ncbi:TetR-like C-terminal domain-containing protein [Paenibacillus sp. OK060]|uniref:TetR-like C-terminal domain-containing protein n=1 Tax=Paenibacillus sp. OK060 TaxID=1881034 RepID=UPI0035260690
MHLNISCLHLFFHYVGSSIGVLVHWIKNNQRESPEDMAEIVMHLLLSNSTD